MDRVLELLEQSSSQKNEIRFWVLENVKKIFKNYETFVIIVTHIKALLFYKLECRARCMFVLEHYLRY